MDPVFDLWKVDDKKWLENREKEWEVFEKNKFKNASGCEISKVKLFYLRGAKKGYIGGAGAYIYIPFTNPDEARLAFYSNLFGRAEREDILADFIFTGMIYASDMPWIRQVMASFSEGVLGEEYSEIHCLDFNGEKVKGPDPGFFCAEFSRCSIELFKGKWNYHGFMECFGYFVSALSSISAPYKPDRIRIPALLEAAYEYSRNGSDELVLHFAQQIVLQHQEMTEIYESWFG